MPVFGTLRFMVTVDLTSNELRLMIQSLDHCLATCKNEKQSSSAVCSDCEAAKALRERLKSELSA